VERECEVYVEELKECVEEDFMKGWMEREGSRSGRNRCEIILYCI